MGGPFLSACPPVGGPPGPLTVVQSVCWSSSSLSTWEIQRKLIFSPCRRGSARMLSALGRPGAVRSALCFLGVPGAGHQAELGGLFRKPKALGGAAAAPLNALPPFCLGKRIVVTPLLRRAPPAPAADSLTLIMARTILCSSPGPACCVGFPVLTGCLESREVKPPAQGHTAGKCRTRLWTQVWTLSWIRRTFQSQMKG